MNESGERIIQNLREFNRKERFYVVGMALGNHDFRLDYAFREKLGKELELSVPEDAFAAMDYHLDWIYASIFLAKNPAKMIYEKTREITATQEDSDFVIAYQEGEDCHIILIEAKGAFAFNNAQLNHKACRLSEIFGSNGEKWSGVVPHFAIISPYKPTLLNYAGWPSWMHPDGKVKWLKLDMRGPLKKITRCNSEGKTDKNGQYWKVESTLRGIKE